VLPTTYIYMHSCMHTYIYAYLYICILIYLYICILIYLYICILIYMHSCMRAYSVGLHPVLIYACLVCKQNVFASPAFWQPSQPRMHATCNTLQTLFCVSTGYAARPSMHAVRCWLIEVCWEMPHCLTTLAVGIYLYMLPFMP
jgi:hypothetical protein